MSLLRKVKKTVFAVDPKFDPIPMSIGIQNTNSYQKNLEPIP
jgi:hypothetical protein